MHGGSAQTAPAQSPAELSDYMTGLRHTPDHTAWKVWTRTEYCKSSVGDTIVPLFTDHQLDEAAKFIRKGQSHYQKERCIAFVADATHDVTKDRVKLWRGGFAGTHFDDHHAKWADAYLPSIQEQAIDALIDAMWRRHKIWLPDVIGDWHYDGKPGEMLVVS